MSEKPPAAVHLEMRGSTLGPGSASNLPYNYGSDRTGPPESASSDASAGTQSQQQPQSTSSSAFDPSLHLGRHSLGRHSLGRHSLGRHSLADAAGAGAGAKAAAASAAGSTFTSSFMSGREGRSIFRDENAMEPEQAETEYSRQAAANREVRIHTRTRTRTRIASCAQINN